MSEVDRDGADAAGSQHERGGGLGPHPGGIRSASAWIDREAENARDRVGDALFGSGTHSGANRSAHALGERSVSGEIGKARTRARSESATEAPAEPLPATHIARYRIDAQIGAGAVGRVFRAHDPELDRPLAIKVLQVGVSADPVARTRMMREARALARLSHPNVIQVYDVGSMDTDAGGEAGDVFIAMELVDGQTLRAKVAQRHEEKQRLASSRTGDRAIQAARVEEILRLFIAAGEGLAAAHRAGLIHRDFKPENVIVGHDGRVRVLDFGLARPIAASELQGTSALDGGDPETTLEGQSEAPSASAPAKPLPASVAAPDRGRWGSILSLTQTGALLGTPYYLAPECYLGQAADASSDQFAFCVALYEGVYGQRPFAGRTVAEYSDHVISGDVSPGGEVPGVPRRLETVIRRGLSRDPRDRFATMSDLLAAIRDTLEKPAPRASPTALLKWAIVVLAALIVAGVFYGRGGLGPLAGFGDESVTGARGQAEQASSVGSPGVASAESGDPGAEKRTLVGESRMGAIGEHASPQSAAEDSTVPDLAGSAETGSAQAGTVGELDSDLQASSSGTGTLGNEDGSDVAPDSGAGERPEATRVRQKNSVRKQKKADDRKKSKTSAAKSTGRWCSLREDTFKLLREHRQRRRYITAGSRCYDCRVEPRAWRTRSFSPRDCDGYQVCHQVSARACAEAEG